MNIDLHGLTQEQAIGKIQNAIFSAKTNNYDSIKIITGKGNGVLKYLLENYCDENNLNYQLLNDGQYLIYLN